MPDSRTVISIPNEAYEALWKGATDGTWDNGCGLVCALSCDDQLLNALR